MERCVSEMNTRIEPTQPGALLVTEPTKIVNMVAPTLNARNGPIWSRHDCDFDDGSIALIVSAATAPATPNGFENPMAALIITQHAMGWTRMEGAHDAR